MVYTLAKNAISSLSIAIEYFKKIYYHAEEYSPSEIDEAFKICITFLENAIELLLKTILANANPESIYCKPKDPVIQDALRKSKLNTSVRPEDILISNGNLKTITYHKAVMIYTHQFHGSDKVFRILDDLGSIRNAITHFGINKSNLKNELIIGMINAFDVIYNYLYPQLIEIDSLENFFTSDGLIVDTIHGAKPLFDEDFIYNNILDFLDELMETSEAFALKCRLSNPTSKINEFTKTMKNVVEDQGFVESLEKNQTKIVFYTCNFSANDYHFDIIKGEELWDTVLSCYSPFFNVTAFCNDAGIIYFLIVHDQNELYLYNNNSTSYWPQRDEPEPDKLWLKDLERGLCQRLKLSKNNIFKVFNEITSCTA